MPEKEQGGGGGGGEDAQDPPEAMLARGLVARPRRTEEPDRLLLQEPLEEGRAERRRLPEKRGGWPFSPISSYSRRAGHFGYFLFFFNNKK